MRRRRLWLELGIIVVGIAVIAAWTRPRVEESIPSQSPESIRKAAQKQRVGADPVLVGRPIPQPKRNIGHGLRFLGKNNKGFEEYENLKDGTVLIKVPGGKFTMGSNDGYRESTPVRTVTLRSYYIAKYDVTNAQFGIFADATNNEEWKICCSLRDQRPAVCIRWETAQAYCKWAGLRLPTEEEWELAARGYHGNAYPWGNKWDARLCRNSAGGACHDDERTLPVGSYPSGASHFGCLDMAGNVWQWTASWYTPNPNDHFDEVCRSARGASWNNTDPPRFLSSYRGGMQEGLMHNDVGFRCARSL